MSSNRGGVPNSNRGFSGKSAVDMYPPQGLYPCSLEAFNASRLLVCTRLAFKMWRDPLFALPKADTLTYLVDGSDDLHLEIPEKNYTFPNESTEGKVQILQIMGTWCPNCMDESRYLVEVYEKYKGQDLAITGFCFERGATPELRQEIVDGYQKNMSIPYKLIEAGSLRANAASQVFNQLNHIMSYPTLIVVDKTGKVAKIHTGFSGPATGEVYVEYVNEMDALLEELLAE